MVDKHKAHNILGAVHQGNYATQMQCCQIELSDQARFTIKDAKKALDLQTLHGKSSYFIVILVNFAFFRAFLVNIASKRVKSCDKCAQSGNTAQMSASDRSRQKKNKNPWIYTHIISFYYQFVSVCTLGYVFYLSRDKPLLALQ